MVNTISRQGVDDGETFRCVWIYCMHEIKSVMFKGEKNGNELKREYDSQNKMR